MTKAAAPGRSWLSTTVGLVCSADTGLEIKQHGSSIAGPAWCEKRHNPSSRDFRAADKLLPS